MGWKNSNLKDFSSLPIPRLGIDSLRGRLIFWGVFLLLMLATMALALLLLQDEKSRSHAGYARDLNKTLHEMMARLRHPTGQFALLNAYVSSQSQIPLRPMLLPFAAIDFNDQYKAHQAVEMAGCLIHYPQGEICVGVGSNPYVGGFIYIVGKVHTTELIGRAPGVLDLSGVHRLQISLQHLNEETHWLAPFEKIDDPNRLTIYGKLEGFLGEGKTLVQKSKPARDFQGWMWQPTRCQTGEAETCKHATYFSVRLPVEEFTKALFHHGKPVWPPKNLHDFSVRVLFESPLENEPTFDSNQPGGTMPFILSDLGDMLQAGEALNIRRGASNTTLLSVQGKQEVVIESAYQRWFKWLVSCLPVEDTTTKNPITLQDTLQNSVGSFTVELIGNTLAVDRELSRVAARLGWVVAAMLTAIGIAWVLVEFSFLRRIALLTQRAAAVSYSMQDHPAQTPMDLTQRIESLQLDEFKGKDEVGILAKSLRELLLKVQADVQREQIRAKQDQEMWHAVGHEILSPLQSLMLLHPNSEDASYRYVQRMQQAVKTLYGHATPGEALQAVHVTLSKLDLNDFLRQIAENAHYAGIAEVQFKPADHAVFVHADTFSLEDTITHILNNAQRYRLEHTPITIQLETNTDQTVVTIANQGPSIPDEFLENIFEYGVSADKGQALTEHRGQGLFVAKTYLAKMGGKIEAQNITGGVAFKLILPSAHL